MQIPLTPQEKELFDLLIASVKHKGSTTTVRVAGGWVRDKVLCQQSVDIDVALDDQSGVEFATNVNEYLKHLGMETRTIAVIQANPDQSKHLETANLRVLGYEIDCVNLRAETYTDSRIPEIRNGTALEDALRRDFTINALFYNVNTESIEDLTQKGLPDLARGLIRTPISAHITFRDDPLRVLRAIRFASRFHFSLDAELAQAAGCPEVHAAIQDKVSRERVYKECEGCMGKENSRPYLAFLLMFRLNLLDVVLPLKDVLGHHALTADSAAIVGTDVDGFLSRWLSTSMRALHSLNTLLSLQQQSFAPSPAGGDSRVWRALAQIVEAAGATGPAVVVSAAEQAAPKFGSEVKALFWAALTASLASLQVVEKGKPVPLIPVLLREGLKMENATMKSVQTMAETVPQLTALAAAHQEVSIAAAGNILRACKELWRDCLLLAAAAELAALSHAAQATTGAPAGNSDSPPHSCAKRQYPYGGGQQGLVEEGAAVSDVGAMVNEPAFADKQFSGEEVAILKKYAALEAKIVDMGLDNVWLLKPLMNGSELMKALQLPKGPIVGKLMEEQTQWQIRNPGNTDTTACLEHLRPLVPGLL